MPESEVGYAGVLDICAAQGWAFSFHQDASSAGRMHDREYVGEVTAMLKRHPRVPQVWCHAGIARRVRPDDHARSIGRLLDVYAHLHIDLSWVAYDEVADSGEWRDLLRRHPDRFVLGSDAFGDLGQHPELLGRWSRVTERLAAPDSHLIESENARRLWWGDVAD